MIQVVGGCYNETCLSPGVRQFYGSGGRAAAALVSRSPDVALHTYGAPEADQKLKRLAALSKFKMHVTPAADEYRSGISTHCNRRKLFRRRNQSVAQSHSL